MIYAGPLDVAGQASNQLFLLGLLLWLAPSAALGVWMIRAQWEYIALYRAVRGVDLPVPDERLIDRYGDQPWQLPYQQFRVGRRLWRIVWEAQADPRLEQARLRVVRRWRLTVAFGMLGVACPVLLSLIGH